MCCRFQNYRYWYRLFVYCVYIITLQLYCNCSIAYISCNILKSERENIYIFLSRRISQLIYYALGGLLMIPLFPILASLFGIGCKGTCHQVPFICPRCSQRHNSNLQDRIIFIIKNATCLDSTIKHKSERNFTARLKLGKRTSFYFRILFISLQY